MESTCCLYPQRSEAYILCLELVPKFLITCKAEEVAVVMDMAALSWTGFHLSSPASYSQTATLHVDCGDSSRPALVGAIPRAAKLARAYGPSLTDAFCRQDRTRWCSTQQLRNVLVSSRCGLTSKGGADEKVLYFVPPNLVFWRPSLVYTLLFGLCPALECLKSCQCIFFFG